MGEGMLVDCERCSVRDIGCDDCAIGVLLGTSAAAVDDLDIDPDSVVSATTSRLDPPLRAAINVLVAGGLVDRKPAGDVHQLRPFSRAS